MAQQQTAIVVVRKDWINTSVRHLINHGNESRSTGDTHLIFGDLHDATDLHGLWLQNIHTDRLTKDGSRVTMRFMIPWSVIVAFAAGMTFERADLTDQSTTT
jgi:hypothetical protein